MADQLNAGLEDGNWSDNDIVIAYVHFLRPYSLSLQQNCSRLVDPTASGKSSVGFPCYFRLSTVVLTPGPKFVEKAAGIEGLSRGGLGSSTEELSVFKIPFPGFIDTTICFVDTPGVDGGERGLYAVSDMICVWFNKTYVCLVSVSPVIDIRIV